MLSVIHSFNIRSFISSFVYSPIHSFWIGFSYS